MDKFSVLIVDDEVHAVKGVEIGVNWEKLGVTTIYTANNLTQAQKVLQTEHIDLLLSDIDMPRGSGLDLLRWVREQFIEVEAIFLTCHSDFDYAKEALQLKSLNYLLKPIDYHELEEAIQKALQKIKHDQHTHDVETSFAQLQKMHQSHMRERLWLDLLNLNRKPTVTVIKEHFKKNQLQYDELQRYLPILIHITRGDENKLSSEENKSVNYSLKSVIFENIVDYDMNTTVIQLSSNYILAIIPSNSLLTEKQLLRSCSHFIEVCNKRFGYDICCYIGKKSPVQEVFDVVETLKKMDRDNVTVINGTINWDQTPNLAHFIPKIPKDDWLHLMRVGSTEKLKSEIKQFIKSWETVEQRITWQSLHSFYQDILQIIFYMLQRKGLEANDVFSENLFARPEKSLESVDTLREWSLFIIDVVMEQLQEPKGDQSVVEKVKQYIRENIGSHKLVREDIAQYVYFNPDYLGRIFKQATGMSISEYILQQRMEHAKGLLIHTNRSISDISLQSGYSNFSYFSTLFKKTTNLSPVDFRKTHAESRNNENGKSV